MIPLRRAILACAAGLLLAPLAAAAQSQDQTDDAPPAEETATPQPKDDTAEEEGTAKDASKDEAKDNDRVCRSVRADPSSRRKTRVCRTLEEWREMNVPL